MSVVITHHASPHHASRCTVRKLTNKIIASSHKICGKRHQNQKRFAERTLFGYCAVGCDATRRRNEHHRRSSQSSPRLARSHLFARFFATTSTFSSAAQVADESDECQWPLYLALCCLTVSHFTFCTLILFQRNDSNSSASIFSLQEDTFIPFCFCTVSSRLLIQNHGQRRRQFRGGENQPKNYVARGSEPSYPRRCVGRSQQQSVRCFQLARAPWWCCDLYARGR